MQSEVRPYMFDEVSPEEKAWRDMLYEQALSFAQKVQEDKEEKVPHPFYYHSENACEYCPSKSGKLQYGIFRTDLEEHLYSWFLEQLLKGENGKCGFTDPTAYLHHLCSHDFLTDVMIGYCNEHCIPLDEEVAIEFRMCNATYDGLVILHLYRVDEDGRGRPCFGWELFVGDEEYDELDDYQYDVGELLDNNVEKGKKLAFQVGEYENAFDVARRLVHREWDKNIELSRAYNPRLMFGLPDGG